MILRQHQQTDKKKTELKKKAYEKEATIRNVYAWIRAGNSTNVAG